MDFRQNIIFFFQSGSYIRRAVLYGVALFCVLYVASFVPLYGWFVVMLVAGILLGQLENIYGGVNFLEAQWGWFLLPTTMGWAVLFVILVILGLLIGVIVDACKKPFSWIRVAFSCIALLVLLFTYGFLYFANHSASVTRCAVVTDGVYARHQSECYYYVLVRNPQRATVEYCERLVPHVYYHDDCLQLVAKQTRNTDICDHLSDESGHERVGSVEGTKSVLKERCYLEIAKRTSDTAVCEKPTSVDTRDKCYTLIAVREAQDMLCDQLYYESNRDQCYLQVAQQAHDPQLCQKVSVDEDKDWCLERFTYSDAHLSLTIPAYYTYAPEEATYRSSECASEVNVFATKFVGKLFLCTNGATHKGGLYLDGKVSNLVYIESRRIGIYTYAIYKDSALLRIEYETEVGNNTLRGIYGRMDGSQVAISDLEQRQFEALLESAILH